MLYYLKMFIETKNSLQTVLVYNTLKGIRNINSKNSMTACFYLLSNCKY